jgi:hypothetical protein
MEEAFLISIVTLLLLVVVRTSLSRAVRIPTPAGSVLITSVLYIIGAAVEVWRTGDSDAVFVYLISVIFFTCYWFTFSGCTNVLNLKTTPDLKGNKRGLDKAVPKNAIVLFFAVTFAAVVAIVFISGANKILWALFQFLSAGQLDVSVLELRVGLASGEERWVAPGYTKQVRDIMLPLSLLLMLFVFPWHKKQFLAIGIITVPIVALLIMSTGERAPLLLFFVGVIYGARRCIEWKIQSPRAGIVPLLFMGVLAFSAFYSLTSSFTSRNQAEESTILIFVDRLVTRAPEENIGGAPIWSRGVPFPGAGWLSEISSVLPGTQSSLSNLIHEYLGGGERGNSVLGMWVDVYYNFDWLLGIPVAALMGILSAFFNHWVNRLRGSSRSAEICGLWLSICMLWVLSPFGFLLYGPFTLSALLVLISFFSTKSKVPLFHVKRNAKHHA